LDSPNKIAKKKIKNNCKKVCILKKFYYLCIRQTIKTYKMELTTLEQFIVDNHKTMTNKEMGLATGNSSQIVCAKQTWLIRKGIVEGNFVPKKKVGLKDTLNKLTNINKEILKAVKVKNTYSNAEGVAKEGCRDKIENRIAESGIVGLILTLPYIFCTMEKKLLAMNKNFTFLGVEKLAETYKAMASTIRREKLPIIPYKGEIAEKIYGVCRETYAHLILDYCGCLSSFSYEIEYALKNKLVPINGTIHITFLKNLRATTGMHQRVVALSNTIVSNGNLDTRSASEVSIRSYFDKVCGFDYELQEVHFYRDKSEMCLVQIKRIA
jgi:hypothetical protein